MTENSSPAFMSCRELISGLQKKTFSSLELTQHFLRRAEEFKRLGAYISLLGESAEERASEIDAASKSTQDAASSESRNLLGLPIAIKDVITMRQGPTTCGSKILEGYVSPFDAASILKLRSSNAVFLGKTNMDEFAMGSSTENSAYSPCLNPWDTSRVPGGSSGGSAVAVAAGLAPAALGTDTGGSIRQPAAFCNLTGLKPTYGRVSRYGLVAYASSLDQIGPMARSAEDCALLMEILSGKDDLDSTSVDQPTPKLSALSNFELHGKKIGVPKEYFVDGLDHEVASAVNSVREFFEQRGATVVEISLPHTEYAVPVYYVIAPAEASSNLARYDGVRYGHRAKEAKNLEELYKLSRTQGFGPEVKRRIIVGSYVLSSGYYDAYYLKAQKVRTLIQQDFLSAFKECDLILCPTTPTTAFKIGQKVQSPIEMYLNDIFTIPVNLAGLPAISFPCGMDAAGLPIGAQLIGPAWHEEQLLGAVHRYQGETDWHQKRPAGF